ncbi:REP-associated tyrosine transposase [Nodularia sp. UHCC 0506]|uniref:REP-associated tyrosine transposase n=1 Tax=Nodularia sp. UHCC 0506 TaxID=3110243 RepID=UPI003A4C7577
MDKIKIIKDKSYFSRKCEPISPENISISRQNKKQRAVWQYRFLEHLIRDEIDFQNYIEYIHYNPVKHGLVTAPRDWEYSSFHRTVRQGIYDITWDAGEDIIFDDHIGNE